MKTEILRLTQRARLRLRTILTAGTKMAILLRIVPYIPWNVFNYIAGVTGMRFYSYLIGSIGAWPWIIICSFIGSGLNSLDEAASGTSGGSNDKTNTIILIVGEWGGGGRTTTMRSDEITIRNNLKIIYDS